MTEQSNYWDNWWRRRTSRRRMMGGTAMGQPASALWHSSAVAAMTTTPVGVAAEAATVPTKTTATVAAASAPDDGGSGGATGPVGNTQQIEDLTIEEFREMYHGKHLKELPGFQKQPKSGGEFRLLAFPSPSLLRSSGGLGGVRLCSSRRLP
ncbi:MAG: hypothetical protein U5Q44_07850 [Dehalococcoidia bacterium]|nr:hypothetical protein [Dehalococcoidia bacterium]